MFEFKPKRAKIIAIYVAVYILATTILTSLIAGHAVPLGKNGLQGYCGWEPKRRMAHIYKTIMLPGRIITCWLCLPLDEKDGK